MPASSNKTPSSNLPPADRLPTAPIIKRPTPKSSSYSQTESNKNLEDLLAKYDENNELVVEINEKLRLTETIASPMSALDRLSNSDVHGTSAVDCDQGPRLVNGQYIPNSPSNPGLGGDGAPGDQPTATEVGAIFSKIGSTNDEPLRECSIGEM